jgi:RimJ/RimL family protein N-acetyltransferase
VKSNEAELVGLCGLVLNPELGEGEVWYLLRPDLWGSGVVTEAARALVSVGFEELRLHRVWASCLPMNPASARVLEKLGFRREGYLRQNLRIHGVWQDSYLYAVLDTEWDKGRGPRS